MSSSLWEEGPNNGYLAPRIENHLKYIPDGTLLSSFFVNPFLGIWSPYDLLDIVYCLFESILCWKYTMKESRYKSNGSECDSECTPNKCTPTHPPSDIRGIILGFQFEWYILANANTTDS